MLSACTAPRRRGLELVGGGELAAWKLHAYGKLMLLAYLKW
jgi:hypothetical protein